jgi:hypothetical protein
MDRETFDKMWELSAPGSAAEGCFLRINQEEYYCQKKAQPDPLDVMPDVSTFSRSSRHHPIAHQVDSSKSFHAIPYSTRRSSMAYPSVLFPLIRQCTSTISCLVFLPLEVLLSVGPFNMSTRSWKVAHSHLLEDEEGRGLQTP